MDVFLIFNISIWYAASNSSSSKHQPETFVYKPRRIEIQKKRKKKLFFSQSNHIFIFRFAFYYFYLLLYLYICNLHKLFSFRPISLALSSRTLSLVNAYNMYITICSSWNHLRQISGTSLARNKRNAKWKIWAHKTITIYIHCVCVFALVFIYFIYTYVHRTRRYLVFLFFSRKDQSCVVCALCVCMRMNLTTCVFTHHETTMCHFPFFSYSFILLHFFSFAHSCKASFPSSHRFNSANSIDLDDRLKEKMK